MKLGPQEKRILRIAKANGTVTNTRGTPTGSFKRLEKKGLIERTEIYGRFTLTPRGKQVFEDREESDQKVSLGDF